MSTRQQTPRLFLALAAVTLVSGLGILTISVAFRPASLTLALLVLLILAIVSENYSLDVPGYSVSLAYPLTMGALLLHGPVGAGLVALVSGVKLSDLQPGKPRSRTVYNLAQTVLVSCLSGWLYVGLGGRTLAPEGVPRFQPLMAAELGRIVVPLALAAVVCATGNVALTGLGIGILYGKPSREVIVSLLWFIPSAMALALMGFMIAQVLATSIFAFPLFAFPLFIARQFYQRYQALSDAYADTIRSLVGALEAKDPYTRGHSERVAEYAVALGKGMGFDSRILEDVEYSALLHDLGKLAIPSAILTKSGKLSPAEMALIREHPARGAAMVLRIPALKGLTSYVRSHHEWYGGGGYPDGLDSEHIPLIAQVLAVADSFDAMTTTRAYRSARTMSEAVAELREGAGTQFSPQVVQAFVRVGIDCATATDGHARDTAADAQALALARAEAAS